MSTMKIAEIFARHLAIAFADIAEELGEQVAPEQESWVRPDDANLPIKGVKCPRCSRTMVKRYSKRTGKPFLGCSGYPSCDYLDYWRPELNTLTWSSYWATHDPDKEEVLEKEDGDDTEIPF